MNIYVQTLRKYVRSTSTWVIIGVAMLIAIFIEGALPYAFLSKRNTTSVNYQITVIGTIAASTAFLSTYSSIFAGFKAATMYKDEVEDGSFLIMLSKPVSRERIIFFKWLALQTVNLMFAFLSAFAFLLGQVIFDNGSDIVKATGTDFTTISQKVFVVSSIIMCVLFVSSLIFSSIALLVSTKASVGASIGISIAFGVIIPITSMVGTFTRKPEYTYVANQESLFAGLTLDTLYGTLKTEPMYVKALDMVGELETGDKVATKYMEEYDASQPVLRNKDLNFQDIGVKTTSSNDAFRGLWVFDLTFQVNQMALIASDTFTDTKYLNTVMATMDNPLGTGTPVAPGFGSFTTVINKKDKFSKHTEYSSKMKEFGERVGSQIYEINQLKIKVEQLLGPLGDIMDDTTADLAKRLNVTEAQAAKFKDDMGKTYRQLDDFVYQASKPIDLLLSKSKIDVLDASKTLEVDGKDDEDIDDDLKATLKRPDENGEMIPIVFSNDPESPEVKNGTAMFLTKSELSFYRRAAESINTDLNSFATVEQKDYASKWTVFSIYIFIALALIPIAYFIVKRQDFR